MANQKLSRIILVYFLTIGAMALSSVTVRADETQDLKNQVQSLQQKVDELQKQLANQSGQAFMQPAGVNVYDQWDPFAQMSMMERQMNQVMKDNMIDFNPREDIKQTPDAYIINMDIPGMEKDKINVEVKNGMLIVSGKRNSEVNKKGPNQFYRQERSFGHFLRAMPLPDDAKTENIEARYINGVLTVKILRNKATAPGAGAEKIKVI